MKEKLRNALLFLILFEIFYIYDTYVTVGGFGVGYQYVGCIALVAICFLMFLYKPDVNGFLLSVKTTGVLLTPYLAELVASLVIWVFGFSPFRQMISGFFEPLYMVLALTAIGSLFYVLKEKAVYYVFWAMSLAYAALAAMQMAQVGVGEFFRQFYVLLSSNATETLPAMKAMEEPCFVYAYSYFLIYFLFHRKQIGNRRWIVAVLVSILGLLMGYKRISVIALLVGCIVAFIYTALRQPSIRKFFVTAVIVGYVLFAAFYVPFVRYGLFNETVQAFQIDTSARDMLYEYYSEHYEVSPTYLGKGLGWIRNYRRGLSGLQGFNVHCEYVRSFIELGFWGYWVWVLTAVPWVLKRTMRERNVRDDAAILGVMVTLAVFLIAENIFFHYVNSIGIATVVLASVLHGQSE